MICLWISEVFTTRDARGLVRHNKYYRPDAIACFIKSVCEKDYLLLNLFLKKNPHLTNFICHSKEKEQIKWLAMVWTIDQEVAQKAQASKEIRISQEALAAIKIKEGQVQKHQTDTEVQVTEGVSTIPAAQNSQTNSSNSVMAFDQIPKDGTFKVTFFKRRSASQSLRQANLLADANSNNNNLTAEVMGLPKQASVSEASKSEEPGLVLS